MNKLSPEAACDLAKMRHLAIPAAYVEEAASIEFGPPRSLLNRLHIRADADFPVRTLLRLASHLPPVRWFIVTRFLHVQADLIKPDFYSKV
jgi:hypothetical protein